MPTDVPPYFWTMRRMLKKTPDYLEDSKHKRDGFRLCLAGVKFPLSQAERVQNILFVRRDDLFADILSYNLRIFQSMTGQCANNSRSGGDI